MQSDQIPIIKPHHTTLHHLAHSPVDTQLTLFPSDIHKATHYFRPQEIDGTSHS